MTTEEIRKWDSAAANYQEVFRLGINDYNRGLLRFWQDEGMIFPGARVLDIGCGVGLYGTYLAELGCDVTLTDISGEMLGYARENMKPCGTAWCVYQCDFREATGKEEVFSGGFDLAISTMSPAVCDTATVRKMSGLSRGWCFLARFASWQQPTRDLILSETDLVRGDGDHAPAGGWEEMTDIIRDAGYEPLTKLVDYSWADARTPQQMAANLYRTIFEGSDPDDGIISRLTEICGRYAGEDGLIIDDVNTKVIWIWWKTKEEK